MNMKALNVKLCTFLCLEYYGKLVLLDNRF